MSDLCVRKVVKCNSKHICKSWCPFLTGLTMGTYLNWQGEKKSGKTDNETFSVSEIPHVDFFGRSDIKFDISAQHTTKTTPRGSNKTCSERRWGKDFYFNFRLSTSITFGSLKKIAPILQFKAEQENFQGSFFWNNSLHRLLIKAEVDRRMPGPDKMLSDAN